MNALLIAGYTKVAARAYRTRALRREQRGSVSLEQVLITAGLVFIGGLVIAAITAAIAKYTGKL